MQEFDLIIIGGGPAGLTAGLYAGRARLNTVLFDKSGGGGWLNTTQIVENYPGFPNAISGPELAEAFIEQAERFGLHIMMEEVTRLETHRPLKLVHPPPRAVINRPRRGAPKMPNLPRRRGAYGQGCFNLRHVRRRVIRRQASSSNRRREFGSRRSHLNLAPREQGNDYSPPRYASRREDAPRPRVCQPENQLHLEYGAGEDSRRKQRNRAYLEKCVDRRTIASTS